MMNAVNDLHVKSPDKRGAGADACEGEPGLSRFGHVESALHRGEAKMGGKAEGSWRYPAHDPIA